MLTHQVRVGQSGLRKSPSHPEYFLGHLAFVISVLAPVSPESLTLHHQQYRYRPVPVGGAGYPSASGGGGGMAYVFRRDACGVTCLVMTYGAVAYADYVVVRWIVLQTMDGTLWAPLHVLLFNVVVFLLLMAHSRAVFSDPGVVPLPQHRVDFSDAHSGKDLDPPQEDWTICTKCEMYRPPRAHHCRICQRCIRKMDHHCPWINNCVGEWNQKYFVQFLFYVGVLAAYSMALVAASWYIPCPDCPKDIHVSTLHRSR